MIWINCGKWSRKIGLIMKCDRVYTSKKRWTPIVKVKIRDVWKVYKEYPDGKKTEEIKGRNINNLGDLGCH